MLFRIVLDLILSSWKVLYLPFLDIFDWLPPNDLDLPMSFLLAWISSTVYRMPVGQVYYETCKKLMFLFFFFTAFSNGSLFFMIQIHKRRNQWNLTSSLLGTWISSNLFIWKLKEKNKTQWYKGYGPDSNKIISKHYEEVTGWTINRSSTGTQLDLVLYLPMNCMLVTIGREFFIVINRAYRVSSEKEEIRGPM